MQCAYLGLCFVNSVFTVVAWNDRTSPQRTAGHALSLKLVDCMRNRLQYNQGVYLYFYIFVSFVRYIVLFSFVVMLLVDSVDLLITGVEASLWLAEQFASDLRRIFPYLNVVTISANK